MYSSHPVQSAKRVKTKYDWLKNWKRRYQIFEYHQFLILHSSSIKSLLMNLIEAIINQVSRLHDFLGTYLLYFYFMFYRWENLRNATLAFVSSNYLLVCINKFSPLQGGTYISLPSNLSRNKKGAILNIRNYNNLCFLYCILAVMHNIYSCEFASLISKKFLI